MLKFYPNYKYIFTNFDLMRALYIITIHVVLQ